MIWKKKKVDLCVNLWQSDLKAISTNAVEVPKVCANCRYNSDHPEKLLGWSVALWWYPITLPSKIKNQVHQNESTRVISELSIGYPTLLGARYSNIPAYTSRLQPEPLFQKVSCLHDGTPLPSPSYHPQKQGASHVAAVCFGSTTQLSKSHHQDYDTSKVGNLNKRPSFATGILGWGLNQPHLWTAPGVHTECWDELHLRKPGNSMPWVENLTKKHLELVSLMKKCIQN